MSLTHHISIEARNQCLSLQPETEASDAIAKNHAARLAQLLTTRQVDADTRTPNGATLLMWAVQRNNPGAFRALLATPCDDPATRFGPSDSGGETLMHHIVMCLPESVFAQPSSESAWHACLRDFLISHQHDIDWTQTNHQGMNACELAMELDASHTMRFIEPYVNDSDGSLSGERDSNSESDGGWSPEDRSENEGSQLTLLGHKRHRP